LAQDADLTSVVRAEKEDQMQVGKVMSKNVKIASPSDTIETAASLMAQINCGALPVAENDKLVGVITDRDITLRAVAKGKAPGKCTVREVMSPEIKYIFDDETTEAAAHNMSKLQVRRLPVLNRQKRLVGIVALGDLAIKQDGPAAANALKGISET
jgi:CBS domain-containing protein